MTLGQDNYFLNMAPKAQAAKEKYINMTSPKFKKELYIKGQYQQIKMKSCCVVGTELSTAR